MAPEVLLTENCALTKLVPQQITSMVKIYQFSRKQSPQNNLSNWFIQERNVIVPLSYSITSQSIT